MSNLSALRPVMPILVGAMVMLSLGMGLRQSLGLFMPPVTQDVGISVSQFTFAIAIQNLVWGVLQPAAGMLAVRWGYRRLLVAGALLHALGLAMLATAGGMTEVMLGAGIAVGVSMAFTGPAFAQAIASRVVPVGMRSAILGIVSAAGSLGALLAAPMGQALTQSLGWRVGMFGFVALALLILPAAWYASRVDALPAPKATLPDTSNARQALAQAFRHPPFVVMSVAYFVCGLQLLFLSNHLPSYLVNCGIDPMVGAQALGIIGGFNVLGSLFFGWAGGRFNKLMLLGSIYLLRSLGILWYFSSFPTVQSTLVFAAVMGFLWLGVSPLVAGSIGETFGLRWQAMLIGVAFCSHQIGSFVGVLGGGLLYDWLGSYDLAWRIAVGVGVVVGLIQVLASRDRRPPPMPAPA